MSRRPIPASLRSGSARLTALLAVAGALLLGGTGALLAAGSGTPLGALGGGPTPTPVPTIGVALAGADGDTVPWKRALTFAVVDGTIESVSITGPDGTPYDGTLTPQRWVGRSSLLPGALYVLHAEVRDGAGEVTTYEQTFRAAAADRVLHATINDPGQVVGVGQPVVVRFDKAVKGPAARAAVLERLPVTTTPAVEGAWRWYNSFEAHYRGKQYWKPGTTVTVSTGLEGLRVPGTDTWGEDGVKTGTFTVGSAVVSVADLARHTLTVTENGKVLRVLKMSGGNDKYPTKGGVHIVLLKEKVHLFNSATVGIPTASPDGYYKELPWSVRISNGGAFVHSQPGSIRAQGFRNVSHGCINLSPSNAQWFFGLAKKGDIVDVVNAVVPPNKGDAGMSDWNYAWAEWSKGNLDG